MTNDDKLEARLAIKALLALSTDPATSEEQTRVLTAEICQNASIAFADDALEELYSIVLESLDEMYKNGMGLITVQEVIAAIHSVSSTSD